MNLEDHLNQIHYGLQKELCKHGILGRYIWGKAIPVGYAFKRPYEGGHEQMSQHYAGVAFDVGQNLSSSERDALRNSAINSGIWSYVELVT